VSKGERRDILVVEDDDQVRAVLVRYLGGKGYQVHQAADGQAALDALAAQPFDLVLLDIGLPAVDGLDVLRRMRADGSTPVILLTGQADEIDRIVGLELGADDYVAKPFSTREVEARIRSVLRRTAPAPAPESVLEFPGLRIDLPAREVAVLGVPVEMPAREFDLLVTLASRPREAFTRERLLQEVWSSSAEWQDASTVTEHVRRLRQRLEADPGQPRWIVTVRSVGYRFEP
jgi:two-component system, OmpR family, phosphate regulon response regulator PhoB